MIHPALSVGRADQSAGNVAPRREWSKAKDGPWSPSPPARLERVEVIVGDRLFVERLKSGVVQVRENVVVVVRLA